MTLRATPRYYDRHAWRNACLPIWLQLTDEQRKGVCQWTGRQTLRTLERWLNVHNVVDWDHPTQAQAQHVARELEVPWSFGTKLPVANPQERPYPTALHRADLQSDVASLTAALSHPNQNIAAAARDALPRFQAALDRIIQMKHPKFLRRIVSVTPNWSDPCNPRRCKVTLSCKHVALVDGKTHGMVVCAKCQETGAK